MDSLELTAPVFRVEIRKVEINMFFPYIDLHAHSTLSDGTMAQQQLVDQARAAGVRILAITDLEDLTEIREANQDITFIQAVEIRSLYTVNGKESEICVVGLGFDPPNDKIRSILSYNQPGHRPYISSAVRAITGAGGIAVLTRLFSYELEPESLVRYFKKLAGDNGALEVYYPAANSAQRLMLLELADQYGLLYSAGSDFNSSAAYNRIDNCFSHACCAELLARLGVEIDDPLSKEPIVVVGGFSGSGKGTLLEEIPSDYCVNGKQLAVITSMTTRKPRNASENYTFVSKEAFAQMVSEDAFLEYNEAYSDNSYGTPKQAVFETIKSNRIPVLEIDPTGLLRLLTEGRVDPKQIRRIFIVAAPETLLKRLRNRKSEDKDSLRKRLSAAAKEAKMVNRLYQSVINNDVLSEAVQILMAALNGETVNAEFSESEFQSEMKEILHELKLQEWDS